MGSWMWKALTCPLPACGERVESGLGQGCELGELGGGPGGFGPGDGAVGVHLEGPYFAAEGFGGVDAGLFVAGLGEDNHETAAAGAAGFSAADEGGEGGEEFAEHV